MFNFLSLDTAPKHIEAEHKGSKLGIDFKAQLNDEQYAAVTAKDGPSLILAGAGSGKTRTLAYRFAWLYEQGVKPHEILLITFTNKAAKEMLARVEALIHVPAHTFWGGTFHHIAQRILRSHGESIGLGRQFTIMDGGDSDGFLGECIRMQDPSFTRNKDNPRPSVVFEILSYARNTMLPLEEIIEEKYPHFLNIKEKLVHFCKLYQTRKLKMQMVDYDDLLELWLKLMETDEHVRQLYQNRFNYILVDEYQDTNTLQSKIIDTLASRQQIMAVGDDAQCIYTWRGANFENILHFAQRYPQATIYKIQTNYRSTPQILNLANEVLSQRDTKGVYSKVLIPVRPSKQLPYVVPVMDTKQQAYFIMKRVEGLIGEGYVLDDIVVLYRAHYHAMDLQIELSRKGVAYQITSGVRFFEQAHIKDLVAMIRFVNNPKDTLAFQRFVGLLPKIGVKVAERILETIELEAAKAGTSIFKIMECEAVLKKVPEGAREVWIDIAYTLQSIHEGISTEKPAKLIEIAIEGWYGDYLKVLYPNWSSRRDDLDSLVTFATRYPDLPELLSQLVLLSSEMNERHFQPEASTLRLSTIHQAKGLEFKIVFVIGLCEGWFPIKRAVDSGEIDEELRLFYVAITRAEDELYLMHPKLVLQNNVPSLMTPSRFLSQLSPSTYNLVQPSVPQRPHGDGRSYGSRY